MITYYSSFFQMLFIHLFVGAVITTVAVLHANKKGKDRRLFAFGSGILGEQGKWIKWYSWSLTFEVVTSFLGYQHTQMLYYELGMSLFQAGALTAGAFLVDRLADIFTGNIEELTLPKPDLHVVTDGLKSAHEVIKTKINEAVSKAQTDHQSQEEVAKAKVQEARDKFNDIIKGH